jgi:hypothetical protein
VRGCFGVEKAGALATPFGAGRVYTMPCQPGRGNTSGCRPTLWKEATVPIDHVLAQVPAISEFVVALEQLYAVALRKAQLVGTAGFKVICEAGRVSHCHVGDKPRAVGPGAALKRARRAEAIGPRRSDTGATHE